MRKIIATGFIAAFLLSGCAGVPTKQVNPAWDDQTKVAVQSGKIHIGMTKDQAKAAWGRPDLTRRSVSAQGEIETWQYGTYHWTSHKRYLSFINGKLIRVSQ